MFQDGGLHLIEGEWTLALMLGIVGSSFAGDGWFVASSYSKGLA